MAGKELYIEPILDANLSVIPGLSENIAEMTAQLNETTRILMNVVSNQGLEQHQAAYSGASLVALTLDQISGPGTQTDASLNWASLVFSSPTTGNNNITSSAITKSFAANTQSFGVIFFPQTEIDLTNIDSIKISLSATETLTDLWADGVFEFADGTTETFARIDNPTAIDTTSYNKVLKSLNIVFNHSNSQAFTATLGKLEFRDAETGEYSSEDIVAFPKVGFNSVNSLTFKTISGVENKAWSSIVDLVLPDQNSVAKWSTLFINGNISGVSASIIDSSSKELLLILPAATNDISLLTQTTNLSLRLIFTNLTQTITSVAQRWF